MFFAPARANVTAELGRLRALGIDPAEQDRIIDADASVGRHPRSSTHSPCLTHSRGGGLWLLSRGWRVRQHESLALQGIRYSSWSWPMSPIQATAAAGNSMSLPTLVLREVLRCTISLVGMGGGKVDKGLFARGRRGFQQANQQLGHLECDDVDLHPLRPSPPTGTTGGGGVYS